MKGSLLLSFGVATFLIAITGCTNPADGKPEAVVGEPTGGPSLFAEPMDHSLANGVVYRLGEESKIGFIGSKVTGSHHGGFEEFDGKIVVVDGDPAHASVSVAINTTSLWADNSKLTEHLKSADFFDVASHPRAEFQSIAIVPAADGYTVTGDLDLHGVKKTISFPAAIAVAEDSATATAEFSIKRFDFEIAYSGKADDLIRDEVVIQLHLAATPVP